MQELPWLPSAHAFLDCLLRLSLCRVFLSMHAPMLAIVSYLRWLLCGSMPTKCNKHEASKRLWAIVDGEPGGQHLGGDKLAPQVRGATEHGRPEEEHQLGLAPSRRTIQRARSQAGRLCQVRSACACKMQGAL